MDSRRVFGNAAGARGHCEGRHGAGPASGRGALAGRRRPRPRRHRSLVRRRCRFGCFLLSYLRYGIQLLANDPRGCVAGILVHL